jgi:hypothetical protein
VPPIRTPLATNPDGSPVDAVNTAKQWWMFWRDTGDRLNTIAQQVDDLTQGNAGTGDAIGPVTGFTMAAEVGTRYADDPDRLVHMTVGFVPVCPVPQSVTYLISSDNGATWVWIGSQRMLTTGQQLKVDRLAPGKPEQWKVAAVSGNVGGDPAPILDADLATLYPGVVRSAAFTVAGLSAPPAATGITATIGSQTNVVSADGLTQYGVIPGVVYTDPIGTTDFFVRITVQIYNASGVALAAEQPYGGTQITGGSHTEAALLITYIPGLAAVRYRFYTANRNSQGGGDFSDPTTNTLQMVKFNGNPTLANHYDVAITIPPFTPIDPGTTFNVTAVTASEVGPKYQDEKAGLHTTIGVIPVIDTDYSSPRTVTIWFDFGDGNIVWQGWYSLSSAGQVVRIGDSTLSTDGTRKSGDIWVPANTAQGAWKVYCGAGRIDNGVNATAYRVFSFTVTPVTACLPNGTTNCQFVNDPSTSNPIVYSLWDPGIWYWGYFELTWQPPSIAQDPNFWFSMITVQKGAVIGGVWTPAPDSEGVNEDPTGNFLGRVHDQILQLPGLANDQVSIMKKFGPKPANWVIPVAQNPDGSPNPYRTFRFWMYNVSRLGTDTSGSGGAGTYTLETSCWPSGADHFDLIPQPHTGTLDIRAANPATITLPLTGGNGQPLTIPPYNPATGTGGINGNFLADQSVMANHMHTDAITAANGALAANSVVDPKIVSVGINKVTYGVSIFAGDVVLSRGVGLPVIVLKNDGIYLFGQADASTGASGLTSKPYAVFQNTGLSFFSGGTGPQILLTAGGITMWTVQGDNTKANMSLTASALTINNNTSSFQVGANYLSLIDTGGGNRLDMSAGGLQVIHNYLNGSTPVNNQLVITASQMQFQVQGQSRITIDASLTTGSITLSNGGSASVVVTASTVTITNGSLSVIAGGTTTSITPSTAGVQVQNGSDTGRLIHSSVQVQSGGIQSVLSYNVLNIGTGGTPVASLYGGGLRIQSLPSSPPSQGQFWYDPADSNRVKYVP